MFCQTYSCKNRPNFPTKTGMFRVKQGKMTGMFSTKQGAYTVKESECFILSL